MCPCESFTSSDWPGETPWAYQSPHYHWILKTFGMVTRAFSDVTIQGEPKENVTECAQGEGLKILKFVGRNLWAAPYSGMFYF